MCVCVWWGALARLSNDSMPLKLTSDGENMDPTDEGCTVSNPDMLVMATAAAVVKGEEGGACVRGAEPEVKGEWLGVGCVCCCWDTAMIRGEGEVIGRGGEPTDETPERRDRKSSV